MEQGVSAVKEVKTLSATPLGISVGACLVNKKARDRINETLRFIAADGMAALSKDAQIRTGNEAMDFLGKLRRANPIMAPGKNEGGRSDMLEFRP